VALLADYLDDAERTVRAAAREAVPAERGHGQG
jgi:hypothetical protein